jgi:hypothetical protein
MHLLREPAVPRVSVYHAFFPYLGRQEAWRKFVPGWEPATAAG